MTENTLPLIAQQPEHCFECFRLIRPSETYYQTAENTVLCQQCVRKGGSMGGPQYDPGDRRPGGGSGRRPAEGATGATTVSRFS